MVYLNFIKKTLQSDYKKRQIFHLFLKVKKIWKKKKPNKKKLKKKKYIYKKKKKKKKKKKNIYIYIYIKYNKNKLNKHYNIIK